MDETRSTVNYDEKVQKVLTNFLQANFSVKNDVYLNLLLTHLTEKASLEGPRENDCMLLEDGNQENYSTAKVSPEVLTAWIAKATKLWSKGNMMPPPFILSFALNLASKVSKNEQIFVKLNSENIYENLIKVVQTSHDGQAIVKLGFTNLLHSFLVHKSGLHWIVATSYWIEIVNLNMQTQTIYVKKQGYHFITDLLEKTITFNELFCTNVVNLLVKPIKDFMAILPGDGKDAPEINNKSAFDSLRPSLNFLCHIFEGLLGSIATSIKIYKIFVAADLLTWIKKLLLISHEEQFSLTLLKTLSLICIFSEFECFGLNPISPKQTKDFFSLDCVAQLMDCYTSELEKGHFRNVMQRCYENHIFWKKVFKTPLSYRNGVPIELEHQVIFILLVPVLVYNFCKVGESHLRNQMIEDEFRRDYIVKLLKKSGIKTLQLGYLFKARLSALPDSTEYSILALRYLIQAKQHYCQESGALVFQPLVYCLQDCLSGISEIGCQLSSQTNTFLDTLLEAIIIYIEAFNFTWKDSIETICVMNLAYNFLSSSDALLDTKLIVQGMRLLNTTISKYMSPNMALLMDTTQESVLAHVPPLLYTKCHNSRWEVRDSSLEVIHTLAFNANDRYPAFQKMLLDAELPQLVLQMSLTDGEPFVRSTAVRCLQVAILVPPIWEALLQYSVDFHIKILGILELETEGVVRKEAATLMAKIYDEHDIPRGLESKVYDIMTHAALTDLHWEVKVNALSFWDLVIKKHLHYQGMIDGAFPSFTFSKDNRKIVNLNETEVKKRLIQVLHQLSEIGCLAVFVEAIQDDCDLEVSRTATKIMKDFIELLKKYEVTVSSVETVHSAPSTMSPISSVSNGVSDAEFDTSGVFTDMADESDSSRTHFALTPDTPISISQVYSPGFSSLFSPTSMLDENRSPNDPVPASCVSDQMLDEILNGTDSALLQRIYNPSDQMLSNSISTRGKTALPPREFLQFMFSGIESHSREKSDWLRSLDEFGSLLDDILREYNDKSNRNDMDCY